MNVATAKESTTGAHAVANTEGKVLFPESVYAYRFGLENKVTIVAKGHEDGYQNLRIELQRFFPIILGPAYQVVGDPSPAIGYFPYTVNTTVEIASNVDTILFQFEDGPRKIEIVDALEAHEDAIPASIKNLAPHEVTGYAYNSSDINKAIADAVSKLQAKYPGRVNAKLKESGFTAVGSPVGIAFFYVIMEQQG